MIDLFSMAENHTSDEPLVLDDDAKAFCQKAVGHITEALFWLQETLKNGHATVSTRYNSLGISRRWLRDLGDRLGADEDEQQDRERDIALIRQLNEEIHRLHGEMAKGVTLQAVGSKLYALTQAVYSWWESLGFTYCKSQVIPCYDGRVILQTEFSVSVDKHVSQYSSNPATDQKKIDGQRESLTQNLEIKVNQGESYVLDTPANREWLMKVLRQRFPNIQVCRWESYSIERTDQFQIFHMKANIAVEDI